MPRPRAILAALIISFAVFCIVQDLLTIAGARRYADLQRAALAGRGEVMTVDGIMVPAVRHSVQMGLLAAGGTAVLGLAAAFRETRRQR